MTAPQNRNDDNERPGGIDPARISARCATAGDNMDQHRKCLGRVYVWPPIDGDTVVPCECPVCDHPRQWRGRPPGT